MLKIAIEMFLKGENKVNISKLFLGLALLPIVCTARTEVKKINGIWYLAEKNLDVFDDVKGKTVKKPYYFSMESIKVGDTKGKEALEAFIKKQQNVARDLVDLVRASAKYWDKFNYHDKNEKKAEKDSDEKLLDHVYKNLPLLDISGWFGKPADMLLFCLRSYWQAEKAVFPFIQDPFKEESFEGEEELLRSKRSNFWIAYVTDKKPQKPLSELCKSEEGMKEALNSVQMMVSVSTQDEVPFTMHMGIFANPVIVGEQKQRPKNLSVELHGFAAAASLAKYGSRKIDMITQPLEAMRKILVKNLGKDCIVGVRSEGGWKVDSDNDQSPITVTRSGRYLESFSLSSPSDRSKIIFKAEDSYQTNPEEGPHAWFFGRIAQLESYPAVTIELTKLAEKF